MKKIAIIIPILFLALLGSALATSCNIITGTVYSPSIGPGNEVGGAEITITCNPDSDDEKELPSFEAMEDGTFAAQICPSTCPFGSVLEISAEADGMEGETVRECHNSVCDVDVVLDSEGDDPEDIPEFSSIAAGLAVVGSGISFMFLRRVKK